MLYVKPLSSSLLSSTSFPLSSSFLSSSITQSIASPASHLLLLLLLRFSSSPPSPTLSPSLSCSFSSSSLSELFPLALPDIKSHWVDFRWFFAFFAWNPPQEKVPAPSPSPWGQVCLESTFTKQILFYVKQCENYFVSVQWWGLWRWIWWILNIGIMTTNMTIDYENVNEYDDWLRRCQWIWWLITKMSMNTMIDYKDVNEYDDWLRRCQQWILGLIRKMSMNIKIDYRKMSMKMTVCVPRQSWVCLPRRATSFERIQSQIQT